ncbi:MAG TPA: TolC family protein [Methylomirabilota bacterium]|jgi:HAE1 family hydrophobic/amphiphilic exporter-1|nr:TolC family protein [Methylomirabilota bacterium]
MKTLLLAMVIMLVAAPAWAASAGGDTVMVFARPLTLDACIDLALRHNLRLKLARADLSRAHGSYVSSLAKFTPVLSGSARQERSEDRVMAVDSTGPLPEDRTIKELHTVSGGISQQLPGGMQIDVVQELGPTDVLPSKTRNRQFQATVTQPLLRGAGLTASMADLRGSTYDEHAREADLRDIERQTIFDVKVAYYNTVRDVELLRVNKTTLAADSLLVEASNAMVEAKVASRRDVLSARIRLADDAATVVASERDALQTFDVLKDVMGITLESRVSIADTSLNARFVTLDEASLVQKVIDSHPSMRSAELAVKRSRLDLTVAQNSRLPQVDLKASYFNDYGESINSGEIGRGTGWQASVNLAYPLFDRSAEGETISRRAELGQAQDRLKLIERQLTLRVREIVRTVRTSAAEVTSIQQTIDAADDKLQFATAMFNLGRASNLDITDARTDLVKAQTQMVKKLVDYNAQLALLESLTGEPVTR